MNIEDDMTAEKAQKIVDHLAAALELDPHNDALKKTNADRIKYAMGGIQDKIQKGKFQTLVALRRRFGYTDEGVKIESEEE